MGEVVSDTGESIVVRGTADSACVLVLSDMFYPGWEAVLRQESTTCSVAIQQAFGGWRAVAIPNAGPYEVEFTYEPAAFRIGLLISSGTFVLWLVGCAVTTIVLRTSRTF